MEESNQQTPEASGESPKSNTGLFVGTAVLILVAIGAYFVFGTNKNLSVAPVTNSTPTSEALQDPNIKTFNVDGSSFAFSPDSITVNKGDSVKIIFKDTDGRHDLVIDGYNVKTDIIGPGKTDTIEFTATKTGTFEYYCSLPGHKAQGMTGKLVVI